MKKLLFGLLGILFLGTSWSATLPAGYKELEYIESTGTQWIDTGIVGNTLVGMEYEFTILNDITAGSSLFGARATNNIGSGINIGHTADKKVTVDFFDGSRYSSNVSFEKDLPYRLVIQNNKFTLYNSSTGAILDSHTFNVTTKTLDYVIILFGLNNGGSMLPGKDSVQAKNLKLYTNNGSMNLVPAKNSSGVVGMYDTVNDVFYTNQGTGTFTAGPLVGIHIATTAYNNAQFNPVVNDLNTTIATIRDVVTNTINQTKAIADLQAKKQTRPDEQCPAGKKCLLVEDNDGVPHWYEIIENVYGLPAGYTPLEYIEATGTQYIDTGVVANTDKFKFVSSISPQTTADTVMYGMMATDYGSPGITLGTLGKWRYGNTAIQSISPAFSIGNVYNSELSWKKIVINGTTYTTDNATNWDNNLNYSIYLFARNAHGTVGSFASARIYYFKIYNNNALVRDMVPAKNSSGVIGMYDLVNDVFYTNSGTGTFTAGPEI